MLISIPNPETQLNTAYLLLQGLIRDNNYVYSSNTERKGHVFCFAKMNEFSVTTFSPVHESEGDAYVKAEILAMVALLRLNGIEITFAATNKDERKEKIGKPKITRSYIEQSSNLKDALRRLDDSGYGDMQALYDHLDALRIVGSRPNKYSVADYVFKDVQPHVAEERKKQRSGVEWMQVKNMVEKLSELPNGYQSADEFATFASKEEIDGIKHQNH